LVTVGQRRGMGGGAGERRYAVSVDVANATITVGASHDLDAAGVAVRRWSWVGEPAVSGDTVLVQTSAHGRPALASFGPSGVQWRQPQHRVAPGQSVVLYDAATGTEVLGGGIATG
jgi:tRNA-specific 2-thiouridylase